MILHALVWDFFMVDGDTSAWFPLESCISPFLQLKGAGSIAQFSACSS